MNIEVDKFIEMMIELFYDHLSESDKITVDNLINELSKCTTKEQQQKLINEAKELIQ